MRHSRRLTILRAIVASVTIFTTSIFITSIFVDIGVDRSPVKISRRARGGGWNEFSTTTTTTTITSSSLSNSSKLGRMRTFLNSSGTKEKEEEEEEEVKRLKLQIDGLHRQLTRLRFENAQLRRHLAKTKATENSTGGAHEAACSTRKAEEGISDRPRRTPGEHLADSILGDELIRRKLIFSEVLEGGQSLKNEFELMPFARFTATRIYLVEPGLQKRVVEKPIGFKKASLDKIIDVAVAWLNENRNRTVESFHLFNSSSLSGSTAPATSALNHSTSGSFKRILRPYRASDFLEGIYRTVPGMSEHYELHFRDLDKARSYRSLVVTRVFSAPLVVSSKLQSVASDLVHVIVPLRGRESTFRQFLEKFESVCIGARENVLLTIVHFGGGREFESVNASVSAVMTRTGFLNIRLMSLHGEFSRGRALTAGASWDIGHRGLRGADVLLFFCDVDVMFTSDFLQRCRLNAEPGLRVYYPILFSLYNPNTTLPFMHDAQDLLDLDKRRPDGRRKNVVAISVDSGFWRDFGYGMTCQYLSDFKRSGGFDATLKGWGMEDVYLYRKYVKSPLMVVRATDPGIIHAWHDKVCPYDLKPDQYKSCIRSKALNEASHAQLGMLLFRAEIEGRFSNRPINATSRVT